MRKLLLALTLIASSLHAETVYLSAHGKTFHRTDHCMSLSRAKHVFAAERQAAESHKLRECGICYRKHSTKSAKAAGNVEWAKEVGK